jgi:hypothetical protein
MEQTYTLHILGLQCFESQEVDGDEVVLTINDVKQWEARPEVMCHVMDKDHKVSEYDFPGGRKLTREGWLLMTPYNPGQFIIKGLTGTTVLKLWDEDLLTRDDLIGQAPISVSDASGGSISLVFDAKGARYRLTYKVEV